MFKAGRWRGFGFIFSLLLAPLIGNSQVSNELYHVKQKEAIESLKKKDYDTALRLYSEAIDLFPKTDEFTPKSRNASPSESNLAAWEYRGLQTLYMGRFWAHLGNKNDEMAQAELNKSLMVVDLEKRRDHDRVRLLRASVSFETEEKIKNPNSHNSPLIRSAFLFNGVGQGCDRSKTVYSYDPRKDYGPTIPERFLLDKTAVRLILQIAETCRAVRVSEAEAYATAAVDLKNRAYLFHALKLSNELVQSDPRNHEAYRLRVKVNRHLGNDQQALLDEQRLKELGPAN